MRGLRRGSARGEPDPGSSCFGHKDLLDRWTKLVVGHPFDTIKVSRLSCTVILRDSADVFRLDVSPLRSDTALLMLR